MTKAELIEILRGMARSIGYRNKAGLFWKKGGELTMLIQLQRSSWGDGVYVNYGATTNAMITKPVPPGSAYWGLGDRAESLESPFLDVFERLIVKSESVTREEASAALQWLLGWMEDHYGDEEAVKRAELAAYPNEWGIMIDWAKGKPRAPAVYFPDAPYYKKS